MRKKQKLADAMALSSRISLVEGSLMGKRLTPADVSELEAIVADVRALKTRKILIAPPLLQRVKALEVVSRRIRALTTATPKTP